MAPARRVPRISRISDSVRAIISLYLDGGGEALPLLAAFRRCGLFRELRGTVVGLQGVVHEFAMVPEDARWVVLVCGDVVPVVVMALVRGGIHRGGGGRLRGTTLRP